MVTTVLGYLALAGLALVFLAYPLRTKTWGQGLICFAFFLGLGAFGGYVFANLFDFYQRGEVQMLVRGGTVVQIAKQPVKAYFFIAMQVLIGACSGYAGWWFLAILLKRLRLAPSSR